MNGLEGVLEKGLDSVLTLLRSGLEDKAGLVRCSRSGLISSCLSRSMVVLSGLVYSRICVHMDIL